MKRVWITGATGFTGRHLVHHLRSLGLPLEIVGLDCRPGAVDGLNSSHTLDLTDPNAVGEAARSLPPDRVLHLAGLLPPAGEAEMWRVNVGGTQNLLQALGQQRKKKIRVVSIGSAAEYRKATSKIKESDPCGGQTSYGRTKWAQSVVALACGEEFGLEVMVARTFNLLGPGLPTSLVAGSLCEQFSRNGVGAIKLGNQRPKRDFVDVRDAVSAYWLICDQGKPGQTYNVCTGRATSIKTLVQLFSKFADGPRTLETERSRTRSLDLDRVFGDNAKLRRLGWSATIPLGHSVRDMLASAGSP